MAPPASAVFVENAVPVTDNVPPAMDIAPPSNVAEFVVNVLPVIETVPLVAWIAPPLELPATDTLLLVKVLEATLNVPAFWLLIAPPLLPPTVVKLDKNVTFVMVRFPLLLIAPPLPPLPFPAVNVMF